MISSIRVRLAGGPFNGETHELYAFAIETPPDQIEFVVLDDIGIPDHAAGKAKYLDAFFKNLNWSVCADRFAALAK